MNRFEKIETNFVGKLQVHFRFRFAKRRKKLLKSTFTRDVVALNYFGFWLLSDARNLKSLVEFRHGVTTNVSSVYVTAATNESGHYHHGSLIGGVGVSSSCRYCSSAISPSSVSLFDDQTINVCSEPDCLVRFL